MKTKKPKQVDEKKKEEVALMLACMIGANTGSSYADGIYTTAEIYKELTGKDLGLKRPKESIKKQGWCSRLLNKFRNK